ncbi:MAG: hypothetical protein ACJ8LV_07420 [Chthoniobacterales bacterium]
MNKSFWLKKATLRFVTALLLLLPELSLKGEVDSAARHGIDSQWTTDLDTYAYYSFVEPNIAIRCTPATAAGVTNTF